MIHGRRALLAQAASLVTLMCHGPAASATSDPSAEAIRVDRLAQDVERPDEVRHVKRLQETYVQYAQFGLWAEMAALFADDDVLLRGDEPAVGRDAVEEYSVEKFGGVRHGLTPGGLHTQLVFRPLVNVSA